MLAQLDSARIKVQVDVGVGDAIFPAASRGQYPTILDLPAPEIPMYPRETVVAEKFHAITVLALGNSRLKDFYDLWFLAQHFRYEGPALAQAVKTTFDRRSAVIPTTLPLPLTEEFWSDGARQAGWDAFLQRTEALGAGELRLEEAVRMARDFVIPATPLLLRRLRRPATASTAAAGPRKPPAYFCCSAISNSAASPERHRRLPPEQDRGLRAME